MGRAGATLQVLIIVKHFISRKIVANIKWRRICLATNVPKSLNLSASNKTFIVISTCVLFSEETEWNILFSLCLCVEVDINLGCINSIYSCV